MTMKYIFLVREMDFCRLLYSPLLIADKLDIRVLIKGLVQVSIKFN